MVSSILPVYLVLYLHLSPLAFGTIDGLYQGFASIARLAGGFLADRWRSHKAVASFGYGLSAVCKLAFLAAGNVWTLLAVTIAIDRTGKGIRTAPRDALISLSSNRADLASAVGAHRALDAAGAVLGPLVAFVLFWYSPGAFDVIFVVSFCVAMIGLGVILFFVDGSKKDVADGDSIVSISGAIGLLRIPAFWRFCVAGTVLSLATVDVDGYRLRPGLALQDAVHINRTDRIRDPQISATKSGTRLTFGGSLRPRPFRIDQPRGCRRRPNSWPSLAVSGPFLPVATSVLPGTKVGRLNRKEQTKVSGGADNGLRIGRPLI